MLDDGGELLGIEEVRGRRELVDDVPQDDGVCKYGDDGRVEREDPHEELVLVVLIVQSLHGGGKRRDGKDSASLHIPTSWRGRRGRGGRRNRGEKGKTKENAECGGVELARFERRRPQFEGPEWKEFLLLCLQERRPTSD